MAVNSWMMDIALRADVVRVRANDYDGFGNGGYQSGRDTLWTVSFGPALDQRAHRLHLALVEVGQDILSVTVEW